MLLQDAYGQLQNAQETLDDVLINGTTSPVLLAADLTTAAAQINSQPFSNAILSSLSDSQACHLYHSGIVAQCFQLLMVIERRRSLRGCMGGQRAVPIAFSSSCRLN